MTEPPRSTELGSHLLTNMLGCTIDTLVSRHPRGSTSEQLAALLADEASDLDATQSEMARLAAQATDALTRLIQTGGSSSTSSASVLGSTGHRLEILAAERDQAIRHLYRLARVYTASIAAVGPPRRAEHSHRSAAQHAPASLPTAGDRGEHPQHR